MAQDIASDGSLMASDPRVADGRDLLVRRRQLRVAGVLLLLQGVLMEGLVALSLPVLLAMGLSTADLPAGFHVFALPYLNENIALMMLMSGIFGALRTIGAIGVLRNRVWGFGLSVINCAVTLVLMIFMLPAGVADGLLSGGALALLLLARFGRSAILPPP
jgi:uncharacterized membrane protein (DUF2068 family)